VAPKRLLETREKGARLLNAVSVQTGTADLYRLHREEKKIQHAAWKEKNLFFFKEKPVVYKVKKDVVFFRESGKPQVDFALTTGRWTVQGESTVYHGGAEAFWHWYQQRRS